MACDQNVRTASARRRAAVALVVTFVALALSIASLRPETRQSTPKATHTEEIRKLLNEWAKAGPGRGVTVMWTLDGHENWTAAGSAGDGARPLDRESVLEMQRQPRGDVVWHNGGTGGYRSFVGFARNTNAGVVLLASIFVSVDELGFKILDTLATPAGGAFAISP